MKKKKKQKNHQTQPQKQQIEYQVQEETKEKKVGILAISIPVIVILGIVVLYIVQKRNTVQSLPINMDFLLATGTPYTGISAPSSSQEVATTSASGTPSLSATGTLRLPKLPAVKKKPVEQKTLKGQEAIDFIKTLPLETQRQIMASQSQSTTTSK